MPARPWNGSGYQMQGPPGLGIGTASAPGGGLHVVAGWPRPPAGGLDGTTLGINHARRTVNGSGYKMKGPPGLGIGYRLAPARASTL